ncbi:MAG: HD domain-containing protein [Chloroflexi bacterium]|nr:MAG: HD domain-containing protein [Chloroflexota bacterium]
MTGSFGVKSVAPASLATTLSWFEEIILMEANEKESIAQLTRQYGGEWGINHTSRLLHIIEEIGEGLPYDKDIVWMAAHLHDWGAYAPWQKEGVDHAVRSVEVAGDFLADRGYPEPFIQAVLDCIRTHHQGDPNRRIEAVLLSDADSVDFLGVVGILREFSKNPKEMRKAYNAVLKRKASVPANICLEKSRQLGASRIKEMERVLSIFLEETYQQF